MQLLKYLLIGKALLLTAVAVAQNTVSLTNSSRGLASLDYYYTAFSVPDIKASIAWYGDKLGFTVKKQTTLSNGVQLALLQKNEVFIELVHVDGAKKYPPLHLDPPNHLKTPGLKNLTYWVNHIGTATAELESKGIRLIWNKRFLPELKTYVTMFRDNYDNMITFWQILENPTQSKEGINSLKVYNASMSVSNLDETMQWYERVLGFGMKSRVKLDLNGAEIAMIEHNGDWIEFLHVPGQQKYAPLYQTPPRNLEVLGAKNMTFWVDDLKLASQELKAKGVKFIWEATYWKELDITSAMIQDNEGNFISLYQRPG